MLIREIYLEKIRPFYHIDLIKVLVGVRRSGKSEILRQIKSDLVSQGIDNDSILSINFEDYLFEPYRDPNKLYSYILEKIKIGKKTYILLDEVQAVIDFQRILASLKATQDVSIFVTGSNSNILSGDLATLLAGRYVSFHIMPFTYQEVCLYLTQSGQEVNEETFNEYLKWGGLPQRFQLKEERHIATYLNDVFDSIINKDILAKVDRVDQNLLNRTIRFMFDNTAKVFSSHTVYNQLLIEDKTVQRKVVHTNVDRILSSMAVMKCQKYDIKGKAFLTVYEKYYIADLGLRTILRSSSETDISYSLETVVHNELVARGYQCYVGKTYRGEVDLVVFKDTKKCFIQVTYLMETEETRNREFGAFSPIKDGAPKYVLSLDRIDFSRDGIQHLNIIDFLLGKVDIHFS